MLIQKYNPILFSFVICTALFCADTPSDMTKLTALMNATYEDFANMNIGLAHEAKQILKTHRDQTREAFLQEPLFLGISRKKLELNINRLSLGLVTLGGTTDLILDATTADTCSADVVAFLPKLQFTCIGTIAGLALLKWRDSIITQPVERQLKQLKSAQYYKIKAAMHECINKRR